MRGASELEKEGTRSGVMGEGVKTIHVISTRTMWIFTYLMHVNFPPGEIPE